VSDEADRSDALIQSAIDEGIAQARRAPALKPKGSCWYCDEPLDPVRRFCDRRCAEDFVAEEEAMRRAGR